MPIRARLWIQVWPHSPCSEKLGAEELVASLVTEGSLGTGAASQQEVFHPVCICRCVTQLLGSSVNYGMMGHSTARSKSSALVRSRWLPSKLLLAGWNHVFQANSLLQVVIGVFLDFFFFFCTGCSWVLLKYCVAFHVCLYPVILFQHWCQQSELISACLLCCAMARSCSAEGFGRDHCLLKKNFICAAT